MEELNNKLEDLRINGTIEEKDVTASQISSKFLILAKNLTDEIRQMQESLGKSPIPLPSHRFTQNVVQQVAFAMGCPFDLDEQQERIAVLDFMVSELGLLRIQMYKASAFVDQASVPIGTKQQASDSSETDTSALKLGELGSSPPKALEYTGQVICRQLNVPLPAKSQTRFQQSIQQIVAKVAALLKNLPAEILDSRKTLLDASQFDENQKRMVQQINDYMRQDYRVRRQMLLNRLDVTAQGFLWSENLDHSHSSILQSIYTKRRALSEEPLQISLEEIFHVGPELPTWSSARITSTPQASSIKDVIIGNVPDRGGRADEQRPSAKDMMPPWAQRRQPSGGDRGRGGKPNRGGRGGGKRVQSGYNRGRGGGQKGGWK